MYCYPDATGEQFIVPGAFLSYIIEPVQRRSAGTVGNFPTVLLLAWFEVMGNVFKKIFFALGGCIYIYIYIYICIYMYVYDILYVYIICIYRALWYII